ncbi:RHS repeat domain-containing protein [Micromonospora foliorum]|uniref:RHS repeat domain-containing protein n=1 Tax=Micromonospora foliorum TaxID=2911210 RepID=UPI001EE91E38|nr:RHS repeat-associated core domain-containing protein [Micromonospora foliorum]MCG5437182.1 RHS repeat protein [Micromonospora foliorum]
MTWPKAEVAVVNPAPRAERVPAGADRASAAPNLRRAGESPVSVAADSPVRVEVLDRAAAARRGPAGLLLRLSRTDQKTRDLGVSVDYSGFRSAFGGDYGARLRLVRVPECAATEGVGCGRAQSVATRNNARAGTLSAQVSDGLYAVTAGAAGSTGSYGPTSLAPSATWQVGLQSGDFNWSYPMQVPSVPGIEPDLGLNYSSGAVDGKTASTNNQPSWIGEGFDLQPGFIERSYKACAEDGQTGVNDQCWETENAVVSLPGVSGELVRDQSTGVWRAEEDDGWRIERLTGAVNGDEGSATPNDRGEHWKLTAQDGTQYFFGLNRLPGWSSGRGETNSTYTVPVFGNEANEPCHGATFAESWCQQAYRWNLDYVVDPHGDAMAYYYDREINQYGRNKTPTAPTPYVRAGYLNRIEYGLRASSVYTVPASARVLFTTAPRCLPGSACQAGQPADFPDVPLDQSCSGGTCPQPAPTFWGTKRLAKVTTQVNHGGYQDVESWNLNHTFPDPKDDSSASLWLESIAQSGHVGGSATLPLIDFDPATTAEGEGTPNRVDGLDTQPAMNKFRVGTVNNETGGQILVKYAPTGCVRTALPAAQSNTSRCFPGYYAQEFETPTIDWFQKYVVTETVETDLVGGGIPEVTRYEYGTDGAWHFDDGELTPERFKTWGQWRGFQKVREISGNGTDAPHTVSEHVFLRGMHGDRATPAGGSKSVQVDGLDDLDIRRGFARETSVYNGVGGALVSRSVSEPLEIRNTATRPRSTGTSLAAWVTAERSERSTETLAAGGSRTTEVLYRYDDDGLPIEVHDRGDIAVADDDQCTTTTYAKNLTDWIIDAESRSTTVLVPCGATPNYPADLLSDERIYYDGATVWGTAPTRGDVTKSEEAKDWSNGPVWQTVGSAVVDSHGRATSATDPLGHISTTAYTPNLGGPVTSVTATNALGHTSTTTLAPLTGDTLTVVDANGRQTDLGYDPLGRLTKVWQPGRAKATTTPNLEYTYDVRRTAPTVVGTRTLLGTGTAYATSYQLLDGLLRERQTQEQSPNTSGRIVTDTFYDSHGRDWKENADYYVTGLPAKALVAVADTAVPSQTRTVYDGAGRETAEILYGRNVEKWRTSTTYGGDRVSVTPPTGETATTTVLDAHDRTVELRQHTAGITSGYDSTRYGYDRAGRLSTVTDSAGNIWRHFYDLRGRKIRSEDPDAGTHRVAYDEADRPVSTTDGRNRTVVTVYDELGRQKAVHEDSSTGPKLAEWTYDSLPGGKGLATASKRYVGSAVYENRVLGYEATGQATGASVVIPATEGGLARSYDTTVRYNAAGQVTDTNLPAAGDLASETVKSFYTPLGLPSSLASTGNTYVASTGYSNTGELGRFVLGATGKQVTRDFGYDDATGRLTRAQTQAPGTIPVSDATYSYDPAGNLLRVGDTVTNDTQCFAYDQLRRLTEAWTPGGGDCAAARGTAALGGPAAYWHSWTFDKVGNRLSEVRHASAGDTTASYTYPAAGAAQPHTLTSVRTTGPTGTRTDSYSYDADGNTTGRTVNGAAQVLNWDAEGHVSTITENGKSASFIYDADGNRLLRRDATGATLYLGHTEVHQPASGTATATRYYAYQGQPVAMRKGGQVSWLTSDHHGTGELAIDSSTMAVTRRLLTPYGTARGGTGTWPGERGFVGGNIDPGTWLTHLGAREYEPGTGRFISVDPIIDIDDPQQMHGYAYSSNNPTSFSDPDGLKLMADNSGGGKAKPKAKKPAPAKKKAAPKKSAPKKSGPACNAACKRDIAANKPKPKAKTTAKKSTPKKAAPKKAAPKKSGPACNAACKRDTVANKPKAAKPRTAGPLLPMDRMLCITGSPFCPATRAKEREAKAKADHLRTVRAKRTDDARKVPPPLKKESTYSAGICVLVCVTVSGNDRKVKVANGGGLTGYVSWGERYTPAGKRGDEDYRACFHVINGGCNSGGPMDDGPHKGSRWQSREWGFGFGFGMEAEFEF